MSMRDVNFKRITICEVLRSINDRLQGVEHVDARDMLALAEQMAKKMAGKLVEYNKKHSKDWWENNPEYVDKINRELKSYLVGDAERAKMLLQKNNYDRGIVFIAFGEEYDKLASQTIAYSRRYIMCPITVLTNLKKRSGKWDQINGIDFIYLDIPTEQNRRVKIELYKYTPYDKTIYIDVDAVFQKNGIESLFDKLNDSDIVLQRHSTWTDGKRYFKLYRETMKKINLGLPLPVYVGGFWAFKKSKTIELLSQQWLKNWIETGSGRDMPSLACAVKMTGIKHAIITRDNDKYFSANINSGVMIVHRRRADDLYQFGIDIHKQNKPFDIGNGSNWDLVYFDEKLAV
jgi:hypothetical protein